MLRSRRLLASSALACLLLPGCWEARNPPRPEAWAPTPVPTHHPRPLAKGSFEGAQKSLLDEYADRDYRGPEEANTWRLPTNAKTIIVDLLMAAGKDDPHHMLELLTLDAAWGVPDRREVRGRPISTDEDPLGIEFLTALRAAASRLADKASFSCKPLQPYWGQLADSGAEPMWCSYNSKDGLDLIVFRLVKERGALAIDYVGLFANRQPRATYMPGAGLAPPITPYSKLPVSLAPHKKSAKAKTEADEPIPVRSSGDTGAPIPVIGD